MKLEFKKIPNGLIYDVPLAPFTTFGVGGEARFFIIAKTSEEVVDALNFARTNALRIFILGGGSNVAIADNGFNGLVLSIQIPGITHTKRGDNAIITAGAGVSWDKLVANSIEHGFIGLECLSGIPGTVGGAVVSNIGAYGAQCSDTFVSAEVLDQKDGRNTIKIFKKEECNFSYHNSTLNDAFGRYIVLQATFSLSAIGTSRFSYRDNRFDLEALAVESGREPTSEDVRITVLKMRKEKGMLNGFYKSAGSFFRMLFVSAEKYLYILEKARSLDAEKEECLRPWAWEQLDGSYKIASGFLLEYTEFQKGYARGPVGISPKHTLSIINVEDARARDIAQLARDMQDAVEKIFSVRLEREVKYIGDVECVG